MVATDFNSDKKKKKTADEIRLYRVIYSCLLPLLPAVLSLNPETGVMQLPLNLSGFHISSGCFIGFDFATCATNQTRIQFAPPLTRHPQSLCLCLLPCSYEWQLVRTKHTIPLLGRPPPHSLSLSPNSSIRFATCQGAHLDSKDKLKRMNGSVLPLYCCDTSLTLSDSRSSLPLWLCFPQEDNKPKMGKPFAVRAREEKKKDWPFNKMPSF